MDNGKIFKTKTGFCHVLPDKIVLTRDGIIGNIATIAVGNNVSRVLIIHAIFALGMFYAAFDGYRVGNTVRLALFGLLGLIYLIYGVLKSLNNSAIPVIERSKIKEVRFKKAIEGLTRSRFEVFFENEEGKIKKRLILLPGSLMDDRQKETDKALRIMREEEIL